MRAALLARPTFTDTEGKIHRVENDDACITLLQSILDDAPFSRDVEAGLSAIIARTTHAQYPLSDEVQERYFDAAVHLIETTGSGISLTTEPDDTPQGPTKEELAADKINSVAAVYHALAGQFKFSNGSPKKTLIARELFRRGFHLREILDGAPLSRGCLGDSRNYVRAEQLQAGKSLGDNLAIRSNSHFKGGDDARGGTGARAEENRAASRLLSMVAADVQLPKMKRTNAGFVEGITRYDDDDQEGQDE